MFFEKEALGRAQGVFVDLVNNPINVGSSSDGTSICVGPFSDMTHKSNVPSPAVCSDSLDINRDSHGKGNSAQVGPMGLALAGQKPQHINRDTDTVGNNAGVDKINRAGQDAIELINQHQPTAEEHAMIGSDSDLNAFFQNDNKPCVGSGCEPGEVIARSPSLRSSAHNDASSSGIDIDDFRSKRRRFLTTIPTVANSCVIVAPSTDEPRTHGGRPPEYAAFLLFA